MSKAIPLATAAPVKLPASPTPLPSETRDAAAESIAAEQWLHSHGWRGPLLQMSSPKADQFLAGYRAFRATLEAHEAERRREVTSWRRFSFAALMALLIGFAGATLLF